MKTRSTDEVTESEAMEIGKKTLTNRSRPYRYDGKDEDGQHWGEYLTAGGEPTEDYFRMDALEGQEDDTE